MNYRHGDLALTGVDSLPDGLKKANTKTLMVGSHGNNHDFDNGEVYPQEKGESVIGYFVAFGNTKLFHPDHGKAIKGRKLREVSIAEGIYELRRQNEETHEGMSPVVD